MKMGVRRGRLMAGVGALAAALALSGCVEMAGGIETTDYAPPPHWANIAGFENYEWIDRADALSQAIGEAPPDYSFYAAGVEPWAWTFDDGSLLLVESRPDGLHSYYFEGGADAPFLVRDAEMSYGFLEGGVAVIYGADGQVLTREESQGWLYAAVAGYQRGKVLRRAMLASQERRVVDTMAWLDTSYLWWNWQNDWDHGRRRHGGWRKVREGVSGAVRHRKWEGERRRRAEQGDRFRRWGEGGFRGRPPGNYAPPPVGTQMPPAGPPPQAQAPGGQPGPRGVRPGRPGTRPESGVADRPGGVRPRRDLDGDGVGGLQPDIGIAPGANGGTGVRGRPVRPATVTQTPAPEGAAPAPAPQPGTRPGRPPRPGSEDGFRPRPEPQGGNPPAPVRSVPAPVESDTPAYTAPPPPPAPRVAPPSRSVPSGRPLRSESGDGGSRPARPAYQAPEAQPVRSFSPPPAPSYSPPPAPSYSPPPAPSYSPPPPPPPAPSYSPPPPPPPAPSYSPPPPPPPPPPSPPPSSRYEAPTRIGDD